MYEGKSSFDGELRFSDREERRSLMEDGCCDCWDGATEGCIDLDGVEDFLPETRKKQRFENEKKNTYGGFQKRNYMKHKLRSKSNALCALFYANHEILSKTSFNCIKLLQLKQ